MNPLFYPDRRTAKKIVRELEARAVEHRAHYASNSDRMREKIRAEARQWLARRGELPSPPKFEVIDDGD